MTSRERVLTVLRHRESDRVPFNLRHSSEMVERLRQEQNRRFNVTELTKK